MVDGSEADAACIADAVQSQTGEYAVIDDDIGLDNDEAFTAFVAGTVLCATKSAMSEGFVLLGYTESEVSCIFDSADSMFDLSQDALSDAETDAEELQMAAAASQCAAPVGPKTNSAAPGTESDLDETWDACSNEDGAACFALFEAGEIDGDYQIYGATCGGRSVWPIDCGFSLTAIELNPKTTSISPLSSATIWMTPNPPPWRTPASPDRNRLRRDKTRSWTSSGNNAATGTGKPATCSTSSQILTPCTSSLAIRAADASSRAADSVPMRTCRSSPLVGLEDLPLQQHTQHLVHQTVLTLHVKAHEHWERIDLQEVQFLEGFDTTEVERAVVEPDFVGH